MWNRKRQIAFGAPISNFAILSLARRDLTKHDLMTSLLYDDDINRCHGKFGDEVMEDVTVGRGVEGGVKKGGGGYPRGNFCEAHFPVAA